MPVEWIVEHEKVLTLATQVAMLLVWIFYAQLLFNSYRRQRRPKIILNQVGGHDLESHCLLSNMSQEAIFIESVIAVLETSERDITCTVTDFELDDTERLNSLHETSSQGPMQSGDYLQLGSFRSLLNRVARSGGMRPEEDDDLQFLALELQVIAIYGPEDRPIGAKRRFEMVRTDVGCRIRPTTVDTIRLNSRHQRQLMRKRLADYL